MSRICESLCFLCKYMQDKINENYDEYTDMTQYFCDAYPNGIPRSVFEAGHIYSKPNDNGLKFSLKDENKEIPEIYQVTQEEESKDYQSWIEFYQSPESKNTLIIF